MSSLALQSLAPSPRMVEQPRSSAEVIPISGSPAPSRYGANQRPNVPALAFSILIVGGVIAGLFSMNFVNSTKKHTALTVMEMLPDASPPPPPPPPPPQQQKAVPQTKTAQPTATPVPIVPAPIALSTSVVEASPAPAAQPVSAPAAPGPSAPPVSAGPPAIENVGDLSSRMVSMTPPRYPQTARRNREQGIVVLMVLLGVDGNVAEISISKSSGFHSLDHAALDSVRRWRWSPTKRNGAPVMVRGLVEIPFILQT